MGETKNIITMPTERSEDGSVSPTRTNRKRKARSERLRKDNQELKLKLEELQDKFDNLKQLKNKTSGVSDEEATSKFENQLAKQDNEINSLKMQLENCKKLYQNSEDDLVRSYTGLQESLCEKNKTLQAKFDALLVECEANRKELLEANEKNDTFAASNAELLRNQMSTKKESLSSDYGCESPSSGESRKRSESYLDSSFTEISSAADYDDVRKLVNNCSMLVDQTNGSIDGSATPGKNGKKRKARSERLKKENQDLKQTVESLQEMLAAQKLNSGSNEERLKLQTELKRQQSDSAEQIKGFKSVVNELTGKLNEKEGQVNQKTSQLDAVNGLLKESKQNVAILKFRMKELSKDMTNQNSLNIASVLSQQSEVNELNKQISAKEEVIQEKVLQLENVNAILQLSEGEKSRQNAQMKKLTETMEQLTQTYEDKEVEYTNRIRQMDEVNLVKTDNISRLENAERVVAEKNSELVQKLHETSAQLEATKKTSAEITETTDKLMTEQLEKNADLEVKLAQRTEDLEKIKRDLAEAQADHEVAKRCVESQLASSIAEVTNLEDVFTNLSKTSKCEQDKLSKELIDSKEKLQEQNEAYMKLTGQCEHLNNDLDRLKDCLMSQQLKKVECDHEITRSACRLEESKKAHELLSVQYKAKVAEIEKLSVQLSEMTHLECTHRTQLESAMISLETVTDERSHLQQDLSLSNKAASQLQADLDASVARAAALEAEMLSQNDEHVTQLTRQIGENDELCSLKNSLEEQVQGLELEKEVSANLMNARAIELETLQSTHDSALLHRAAEIDALRTSLADSQEVNDDLKLSLVNKEVQISRLQEEFLSKKNSLDAEMETLKIDADKKLAALNGTVDEVKSTVALQVVTISALQEDVEARKAESARTVAVMAENEASSLLKVKKLQEDLKLEMVTSVNKVKAKLSAKDAEVERLKADLKSELGKLKASEAKCTDKHNKFTQLSREKKAELAKMKSALNSRDNEVRALSEKVEKMTNKVKVVTGVLEKKEEELNAFYASAALLKEQEEKAKEASQTVSSTTSSTYLQDRSFGGISSVQILGAVAVVLLLLLLGLYK